MKTTTGADRIETSIRAAEPFALAAYLMGGYPSMQEFGAHLVRVSRVADVVEVGVPFTDPMADGLTIQRAADRSLANGTTLQGIFDVLSEVGPDLESPVLLMGYTNPFLAYGPGRAAESMAKSGVSGAIVPDLPMEEDTVLSRHFEPVGLALIGLVTPATPESRLGNITSQSKGFVYAVTVTGTTGGTLQVPPELIAYLDKVRSHAHVPVLAGFGIRRPEQVTALAPHVDGAVVGTALIDAVDEGRDPAEILVELRSGI